jgi:hypothetical protein
MSHSNEDGVRRSSRQVLKRNLSSTSLSNNNNLQDFVQKEEIASSIISLTTPTSNHKSKKHMNHYQNALIKDSTSKNKKSKKSNNKNKKGNKKITIHFDVHNNDDKVPSKTVTATVHPDVQKISFRDCTLLQSVTIPSSVITTIGFGAFLRCKSLQTISLPSTLETIESSVFSGCSSLTRVDIPNSVTSIGSSCFSDCTSLTTINIPNSVKTIGTSMFQRCSSLKTIRIPNGVPEIGYNTFSECSSLESIQIPNSVENIEDEAFSECSSLSRINLPNSVKKIGNHVFWRCKSLVSIAIPPSLEWMGEYAIQHCSSLASILMDFGSSWWFGDYGDDFKGCHTLDQRQVHGFSDPHDAEIQIWLCIRFDNLPLHSACYNNTDTLTMNNLKNLIKKHNSLLTSTDAMLMNPLHTLCCNPTATVDMIKLLKAAQPNAASMKNVKGKTPLMMLLECMSKKYSVFHKYGKLLPLVGLLEKGLDYNALEMILAFDDEMSLVSQMGKQDKTSGLLPFMYGASLADCGLDVMYELAMRRPDLLMQ